MSHEFRLADIGEGLDEAEIVSWLVQVGDRVARDQTIVEVLTDKSNAELPAPCDGVIVSLGGEVGDIVEVGAVLAVIDDTADSASADAPDDSVTGEVDPGIGTEPTDLLTEATLLKQPAPDPANGGEVSTFQQAARPRPKPPAPAAPIVRRPKASPATRLEAARRNIDLTEIEGSGPGGRILMSDLGGDESAAPAPAAAPASAPSDSQVPAEPQAPRVDKTPAAAEPAANVSHSAPAPASVTAPPDLVARTEPLRGIRRVIAQNMAQSWAEIPHIHAFEHIDAEPMLELRSQLRGSGRDVFERLTPLSFFAAAVTEAMRSHPQANATLRADEGDILHHPNINVGLAVAAPQGLVVPVLHHAQDVTFASLAQRVRSIVDTARAGDLDAAAYRDGTVTITNFGSLGGEQALPLIRPPESVIFGFGSIADRPFVIDGEVVARKTMHIVVGADHRLLDGDVTTSMLGQVAELLTNPINLVLGD